MFGKVKKIHFVGSGGIGMSGLAEILHNQGFEVSGSDLSENANVQKLKSMGMKIYKGHRAENVKEVDVLVYTSAARMDNPEIVEAKDRFIPVIKRGEMLAELMRMKQGVAVSGSHGKTSTTSMIGHIFNRAELDPTVVVGGIVNKMASNAKLGASNIMIAEADESDKSFLMLQPTIAVITNIDYEHPDTYGSIDDVKENFVEFASKVPFYGSVILCLDDMNASDIIPRLSKRFITYGIQAQADVRAHDIEKKGFSVSFNVTYKGTELGRVKLNLPGEHNILNSLAAVAVAMEYGIDFKIVAEALEEFNGVQRRLTIKFENDSCTVMDDYGHHPTEIKTTLKAIREAYPDKKLNVIFQPHRYTRTQALIKEFTSCFYEADSLILTDIYAASEEPIEGVSSENLAHRIKEHGFRNVQYVDSFEKIYPILEKEGCVNSVIVTLGAGSITRFSDELADFIEDKQNEK